MKLIDTVGTLALIALSAASVHAGDSLCPVPPGTHWIAGPAHGYNDLFAGTCFEPSHPTAGLRQFYGNLPVSDFDSSTVNQHFMHTMRPVPENVIGATLTIRVRPIGDASHNDTLTLRFINPFSAVPDVPFLWSRSIGDLVSNPWITSNYPNGALLTLDLCDLPLDSSSTNPNIVSDLVPYLDDNLDVIVQDDTAVDFVNLKMTTCNNGSTKIFAIPLCDELVAAPQLWVSGSTSGGGVIEVGVMQGQPNHMSALFVGLGEGSAPIGYGATIDILPLIAGPIMLPLDQEGEFVLGAPLPPSASGIGINLQTVMVDPVTGELRSSNGVEVSIQ